MVYDTFFQHAFNVHQEVSFYTVVTFLELWCATALEDKVRTNRGIG